jgi:LuxR family maltose regulon positive regulatory protein
LLAQWWDSLTSRGASASWLALDEDSREAPDFVAQLVQAVALAGMEAGELLVAAGQAADVRAARAVLKDLVDAIDRSGLPLVLILDDYHLARGPETDDLLDLFVRRLPERARLVIATRRRPGLLLSTLRVQGRLCEFGAGELRFSDQEVQALLDNEIEDERLRDLAEQSEGWPIALQLARLWVRDKGPAAGDLSAASASGGDFADYLTTQVFAGLPGSLRTFLLEVSIFARFNAELADAARDASDSVVLMAQLKPFDMLMIAADRNGLWHRQHRLVSDFLAARRWELGPERLAGLNARASIWFEERGLWIDAARHAAAAGDRARVVRLVEDADCIRLCLEEGVHRAEALFSLLAPGEINRSARLRLARALMFMKQGRLRDGEEDLSAAERNPPSAADRLAAFREDLLIVKALRDGWRSEPSPEDERRALEETIEDARHRRPWLRGLVNNVLCMSLLRDGHAARGETCALEAIRYFTESGNRYACVFMGIHLGTIHLAQGRLDAARAVLEQAEALALEAFEGDHSLLALVRVPMAAAAYDAGEIDRATDLIQSSLATMATSEGWPEVYELGFCVASDLALVSGDLDRAKNILAEGAQIVRARQAPRAVLPFLAKGARIMAREGRLQEAKTFLAETDRLLAVERGLGWWELDELVLAKAQTALAEAADLVDLSALEDLSRRASAQNRLRSALRADALRAVTWSEQGLLNDALALIGAVLHRARAQGRRQLFFEEGPRMAELLRQALKRGVAGSDEAARWLVDLLAGFSDLAPADERQRLLCLLTSRERDILRELCLGGSNKVIARALDLTENAVKFHLKNIYRKLGVVGRVMAIAIAGKLGLCD